MGRLLDDGPMAPRLRRDRRASLGAAPCLLRGVGALSRLMGAASILPSALAKTRATQGLVRT
eukprot:7391981-Alexandrium_andersonii.AAC.1